LCHDRTPQHSLASAQAAHQGLKREEILRPARAELAHEPQLRLIRWSSQPSAADERADVLGAQPVEPGREGAVDRLDTDHPAHALRERLRHGFPHPAPPRLKRGKDPSRRSRLFADRRPGWLQGGACTCPDAVMSALCPVHNILRRYWARHDIALFSDPRILYL